MFVQKLKAIGFADVRRGEELPIGVEDCALYPLFTPELLDIMRRLIPAGRQPRIARSVMFLARKAATP